MCYSGARPAPGPQPFDSGAADDQSAEQAPHVAGGEHGSSGVSPAVEAVDVAVDDVDMDDAEPRSSGISQSERGSEDGVWL